LPLGVLIAYLCMHPSRPELEHHESGRIAIAIGAMVDARDRDDRNAHKRWTRSPRSVARRVLIEAASEVGPALFFSLLIITVSFLPIFALEAQEGGLFKPLAYTKTSRWRRRAAVGDAGAGADAPVRARPHHARAPQSGEPRSDLDVPPVIRSPLRFKAATIASQSCAACEPVAGLPLGSEFMPTLNEGTLFLHADHLPAFGHQGGRAGADQNKIIKSFPRSPRCGARRARATPRLTGADRDVRDRHQPEAGERMAAGHDVDKLIAEMDQAMQFPASPMPGPCRSRRASTCFRPASARPLGVKVLGTDLAEMEKLARQIEA
jgi:Cu(I)/Ag(I) efflux system membrane protein CusA/SilA